MRLYTVLQSLADAWESVQVELHGRYSLSRLRELASYTEDASKLQSIIFILLKPVPCLVFTILMDAVPMYSPNLPFTQQSPWLVVRFWTLSWVTLFMATTLFLQTAPTLPSSLAIRLGIPAIVATIQSITLAIVAMTIAFPFPFVCQSFAAEGTTVLCLFYWFAWKDTIQTDPDVKDNLIRFFPVFLAQIAAFVLYPAFNIAFTSVTKDIQPFLSLGLPIMKLFFKNLMHKGVFHMEDLAPTIIVFNMDVYHTMYVSSANKHNPWVHIGNCHH